MSADWDELAKKAKMSEKLPWGLKSDGLAPGSMKNITESKLKAFNVGTMNTKKGMSKKELEEYRKRREVEETEAAYKDFVDSFSNVDKGLTKSWVKGGMSHPSHNKDTPGKKQLYKPKSRFAETVLAQQQIKKEDDESEKIKQQKLLMKKKQQEKKKSNLELFKEELKQIQADRQERRRMKQEMGIVSDPTKPSRFEPEETVASGASIGIVDDPYGKGAFNYDADMQTTNLYLGNINPKVSEQELCKIFGKFGPLASVKIMWPRSEEERQRGRNCGFVAYMNRKDGERALADLQGKEIHEFEMKLGWGKAVPIPPHPIYIPPAMAELTLPPPPSGLPFNAQPRRQRQRRDIDKKSYGSVPPPGGVMPQPEVKPEEPEKNLAHAVVKVVIPTERNLLALIHRMIEFVVREGPMFEAMIMNRELSNPMYRFLFENQSPAHVYYRWKMFTILQGDTPYKWRTEDYRMFKGGSLWRPPPMNQYTLGMPQTLMMKKVDNMKKGSLSESQRDRLEDLLRELTPEKLKIGDAMVWCLEHAEAAEEIVECISESLSILQTPIPKKIARLFLISDILHNCSAKVPNASFFRKYFEWKLPEVFKDIHDAYEKIDARLKAEQFKQKVMSCFHAWEDWAVYTNDYLIRLQNIFLGLIDYKDVEGESENGEDVDGAPLTDDLDGMPIDDVDGEPIAGKQKEEEPEQVIDDVDGVPIGEAAPIPESQSGAKLSRENSAEDKDQLKGFKYEPSKWETVDESQLEAQAVTTSKWELLEQQDEEEDDKTLDEDDLDGQPMEEDDLSQSYGDNSIDGTPHDSREASPYVRLSDSQTQREMTENRRQRLREIEVKVMKYQDDVEAGRRSRKPEISLAEQVQLYRNKLLAKEEEREQEVVKERWRKEDRDSVKEWERAREKERKREERSREERTQREERMRQDTIRERDYERKERDRSFEYDDVKRVRETERSFHGSERRERTPNSDDEIEFTEPSNFRVFVNRSTSRSPSRQVRRGRMSPSPPSAYREETPPSRRKRSRSRERRRHRSRSPKKLSRSGSPRKYKRSRSRSVSPSPIRQRHKHKKSKR